MFDDSNAPEKMIKKQKFCMTSNVQMHIAQQSATERNEKTKERKSESMQAE